MALARSAGRDGTLRPQRTRRHAIAGAAMFAALCMVTHAHAQAFPTKAVRWIVPTPPGGGADTLSRILAQKLGETWRQPVVIENRGGAGGIIGIETAARAPADGHTIMMGVSNFTINAAIREKVTYDPVRDFVPITLVANQPFLLLVHPSLPARSIREFVALAKSRPGQLNYASTGTGGGQHLCMEMLKSATGIDVVHVPYKGSAPSITDLLSGQVQATFTSILSAGGHIKSGRLRALAVTTAKRSQVLPALPTIAEAGVPGYEYTSWFGVLAPAGVPQGIVSTLHADLVRTATLPEVREQVSAQGAEVEGSSGDAFAQRIRAEVPKWKKLVAAARIPLE
jgi:tripartite-type tricarboxylate transporter receptor subunit TctC